MRYTCFTLALALLCSLGAQARKEKQHVSFRDSLDGKFDMSDWLITKKGFVPVPIIVTEPAVGGFGGGIVPIFISPSAPMEFKGKMYPAMPTITAGMAVYTLNDTWAIGGGRFGSIHKWKMRYKLGGGFASVNMNFYHTFPQVGEQKFDFNIKTVPVYGYLGKILPDPRWELGMDYLFMYSKLKLNTGDQTPAFVKDKEMESIVSNIGTQVNWDSRDNSFTPNHGLKAYLHARWSAPFLGSDYNYGSFEAATYWFLQNGAKNNWVTGLRLDAQQIAGTAPFYLKPFIDMRGVPANRYQGNSTILIEVEQRWDFVRRWSALVFGGTGKGMDNWGEFGQAEWAWGYGVGGRYLIARKLNIRMGVDMAMGPEGFTYYIVFGSSWSRQ